MSLKVTALLSTFFMNFILCGYMSQIGQDKFLNDHYFKNKRNGVFIDIGAYDGKTHSNTYFFEKELGWTGICFEPLPRVFEQLKNIRNCLCINACLSATEGIVKFIEVAGGPEELSGLVSTYDPRHMARLKLEIGRDGGSYEIIDVQSLRLDKVLREHNIFRIDYLSLDTEGGELEILKTINFDKTYIYAISVENNYGTSEFRNFLASKGFKLVTVLQGQDEIYINSVRR